MIGYGSKKKSLQPQLTHKIQSKLLITSKHINALSSNIFAKFDHIRHQEQLKREYNMKFMTDRKKNKSSRKTLSSSKISTNTRELKKDKNYIQPQKLVFQSDDYRKKYFELHEDYLEQRRKGVEYAEKNFSIKQSFCNFLNSPASQTAELLTKLLQNPKIGDILKKNIQKMKKFQTACNILKESMKILQVQSWQQIINVLRARIERFRNLDQCTFKILELQSANKKIAFQFEQRFNKIKDQMEDNAEKEIAKLLEDIEELKQIQDKSQEEKSKIKQQLNLIIIDLNHIANPSSENSSKCLSGRIEILEIHKIIKQLNNKLQDIEIQAEENMFRLLKSNEEMMKLERLMFELKNDMNQEIQDQQQKNEENICEINHLNIQLQHIQKELQNQKSKVTSLEEKINQRNREIKDQHILFSTQLQISESHPAQIILKIQQNIRKTVKLNEQIVHLRDILIDKDELNKNLHHQLQKSMKSIQQLKETTKVALFEKDQYKFLLNNLRDQVTEMKKHHHEEKGRIIKEKDEEIIRSNKDILESHSKLNDQYSDTRSELAKLQLQNQELNINFNYIKKSYNQLQKDISQKDNSIKKLIIQCQRYKKQLKEIESSFRQVVDLEEISSKKAINLQSENGQNLRLVKAYQSKNKQLENTNNELIQSRNLFQTELSKCLLDNKELKDERIKLESINIQMRLTLLNKQSQITKLEEENKNLLKQSKTIKTNNDKLLGEVNSITKKFVMFKIDFKKKYINNLKIITLQIQKLKEDQVYIVKYFRKQIQNWLAVSNIERSSLQLFIKKVEERQSRLKYYCQQIQQQKKATKKIQIQQIGISCNILLSNIKQEIYNKLTKILTSISLLSSQRKQLNQDLEELKLFNIEQIYKVIFQQIQNKEKSNIQLEYQTIKQEENQQSQLNIESQVIQNIQNQIIQNVQQQKKAQNVNAILMSLLDGDGQIPTVSFWEKIETNFLAIRRKLNKKTMPLKLDISVIDSKDPSVHSPNSNFLVENDFFRRSGTETDEVLDPRQFKQTNRSQRCQQQLKQNMRNVNEELKQKYQQSSLLIIQLQRRVQQQQIKLVSLENQTSIKGLQHNFKKILDYIIAENIDLFEQTCRIVMKMLHFTSNQIKDYEEKILDKKRKKKGGFFAGLFKN